MAQHKVIDLINQFMEDHGQSSGKDRVMLWLEDVYSKVRRLPWSWNLRTTDTQTGGHFTTSPVLTSVITYDSSGEVVLADTETFTWTKGNDYIQSTQSTVEIVQADHTGRYVYIGEEWYKCVRIAPVGDTNRVFLDKKIVAASQVIELDPDTGVPITGLGAQVSFYRRDLAFETNGIKSMHIDDQKIENLTGEQIYRFKRGLDPRWYYGDSGTPLAYNIDDHQINAPKYAPSVTLSFDSSSTATTGTHRAFYTFFDRETGLESPPGPEAKFTLTSTLNVATMAYPATGSHHSAETTYYRRLYITRAITDYTRNPAYKWGDKMPTDVSSDFQFNTGDDTLDDNLRYYDGTWTRTVLYPAPDEYLRAHARHIDTWPALPEPQEILKLGRQREFIELFHLYFLMKQSIQGKDPAQFRTMQGAFREQLNFLMAQDGDDRRLDPSSWEYRFFSPTVNMVTDDEFTASLKYPF